MKRVEEEDFDWSWFAIIAANLVEGGGFVCFSRVTTASSGAATFAPVTFSRVTIYLMLENEHFG